MEYGCIGRRLPHSFSKEIHEQIGAYRYELRELEPGELGPFLAGRAFRAINVTIPYKEAVIPFLDEVSPEALEIGAVNTVVNRGGRLFGYNTDIVGMEKQLERAEIRLGGRKVLILGTGGTSKTAFAAARRAGAAQVVFVSREKKTGAVTYKEALDLHSDAEIIINTTPCGMYPQIEASPLDPGTFPRLEGLLDAVYNPLRTKLAADAALLGARAENGLYMLAAQAVAAYGLFMDAPPPDTLTEKVFRRVERDKRNIVLIGMPGSGKSTVGRLLAESTGRRFFDTDILAEEQAGMPIVEIFHRKGEGAFRALETQIVRRLAPENGCVIATGGGCVLRAENLRLLKMNGRLYFLDLPPEKLVPTEDRPLAATAQAIEARYRERCGLYLSAADEVIDAGSDDPAEVTTQIERRHGY